MKKRVLGCVLGAAVAGLAALTLTSCDNKDVFHIYAWNDEFQGFFNKYLVDEKADFVAAAKLEKEGKKVYPVTLKIKGVLFTIIYFL